MKLRNTKLPFSKTTNQEIHSKTNICSKNKNKNDYGTEENNQTCPSLNKYKFCEIEMKLGRKHYEQNDFIKSNVPSLPCLIMEQPVTKLKNLKTVLKICNK